MKSRLHQVLAAFLALALPAAAVVPETGGAIVSSSAGVMVNGIPAVSGFAIFDGDCVETYQGKPASLLSKGNLILLGGSSAVRFTSGGLQVDRGLATVTTNRGLSTATRGIAIRPTSNEALYSIREEQEKVIIESRKGSLLIADASGTITLKEGLAASIRPQAPVAATSAKGSQTQSAAQNAGQDQGKRRRGGVPVPASTQTAAGVSHAKTYLLAAVVGGGAVAAVSVMRSNNGSPKEP